jgi:hypothetical protein
VDRHAVRAAANTVAFRQLEGVIMRPRFDECVIDAVGAQQLQWDRDGEDDRDGGGGGHWKRLYQWIATLQQPSLHTRSRVRGRATAPAVKPETAVLDE